MEPRELGTCPSSLGFIGFKVDLWPPILLIVDKELASLINVPNLECLLESLELAFIVFFFSLFTVHNFGLKSFQLILVAKLLLNNAYSSVSYFINLMLQI